MRKWIIVAIVTSTVILIDQVAKWWVVNNVLMNDTIPILEALQPYLQITRTTNTGFAFGMAQGGNTIILILSSLITFGLLWMFSQTDEAERLQLIGLAIVIGGAIGNIIDRIRLSHVIDFVHVEIPGIVNNVSNFADHFVIIGVIVLLVDGFLSEQSKPQKIEAESTEDHMLSSIED